MLRPASRFLLACLVLSPLARGQGVPCPASEGSDDGTLEGQLPSLYHGPTDVLAVSRFTPASYPFSYVRACVLLTSLDPTRESFGLVILDEGSGGEPGTLLGEVSVSRDLAPGPEWVEVDLGCVTVTSGSVWIGVRVPQGSGVRLGVDTGSVHDYRWASYEPLPPGGGVPTSWETLYPGFGPAALMVRAGGGPGGPAQATFRGGSGINLSCYVAGPLSIGAFWSGQVIHPAGALQTRIYFYAGAASGPVLPFGELLVDLSSTRYLVSVTSSAGIVDDHVLAIPAHPALIGVSLATQALIVGPAGLGLCNAIDLVIGC